VSTQPDAEGWSMKTPPAGFHLVSCTKRPLDAASETASEMPVLQSVFSDGLTHVSLFVERFDAQRHRPMRTMLGATNTLMNRHGDWWVTIVGDVPMATIQQFEAMLQRRP
jgi:sigma-E factor negative regulatory protein RseB